MVMYRKSGLLLLILLIVASLALAACGGSDSKNEISQDEAGGSADTSLPQIFVSANGVTLRYPQGWVARDLVEGPLVYAVVANSQAVLDDLNSDVPGQMPAGGFLLTINTISWADLAAALGISGSVSEDMDIKAWMEAFYPPGFGYGEVETVTIGAIQAARSNGQISDGNDGFTLAYKLDNLSAIWISVLTHEGESAGFEDIAYEIIESVTYEAPAG